MFKALAVSMQAAATIMGTPLCSEFEREGLSLSRDANMHGSVLTVIGK